MPSIEELIRQTTGKGFDEMTDEELIDIVNSSRSCYQLLAGAAKARKVKREGKTVIAVDDWGDLDLDLGLDSESDSIIDFGNLELDLGD